MASVYTILTFHDPGIQYERRKDVLRSADERTRIFFEDSYPSMDRNAAAPVITRINSFTRRESVRSLLCQPGKSFNFRHAMDEGKILLFNLSDGILGEQASQLGPNIARLSFGATAGALPSKLLCRKHLF